MPFCRPLKGRIFTVILVLLESFGGTGKVSTSDLWAVASTGVEVGALVVKVEGGTQSLTGTNNGSFGDSIGMLTGEVDLDAGEIDEALELLLPVGDLAARNSGLL